MNRERLHELFNCDVDTGIFTNKVARSGIKVGDEAGCLNGRGYTYIMIDGKQYSRHRLIWLWVHGEWPKQQIDHVLGKKAGDGISNLRDASNRENQQNRKRHRAGHLVGTTFIEQRGKWCSQITVKGRQIRLGYFSTQIEAHEEYQNALRNCKENGFIV